MTIRQPPLISLLVFCTYEYGRQGAVSLTRFACLLLRRGIKIYAPALQLLYQSDNFTTPSSLSPPSTVRLLRNSTALTACSRCLSAILTALPFTPSNQKPSRLFMLSVRNMAILLCLCDIVQGMLFTPETRAVPRHLRAEKRVFVHARILDGSSRHAGRKGKVVQKLCKFVHFCAGKHAYIFDRGLPLM